MDYLKCRCGKIVAAEKENSVTIKCRHCKRFVHLNFKDGMVKSIYFTDDPNFAHPVHLDGVRKQSYINNLLKLVRSTLHPENINCKCGKIIAQSERNLILIKCRHCKRFVIVQINPKEAPATQIKPSLVASKEVVPEVT